MNRDQRNFSTLSALVLLMIFSACSGGGGGGGGIGSAPPDDKVFNQWALTATPISYDCPVIGENENGEMTKTQFNATTAEAVGDGLEIRHDEAATDPNGCNLGDMQGTSYELVDPDNIESCHVSGKKVQIVLHRPFPRGDDGTLGTDDQGCTTEETRTLNLTISDDGLTATGDITGVLTYVGNCAKQYFGTDKKSCTGKARLEGQAPTAADGNALGNGANGSCTPSINPMTGNSFAENDLLKKDVDCDGVFAWLPSKIVQTTIANGRSTRKLIEHFFDAASGEARISVHQTDSARSPIERAQTWQFNADQTQVTSKTYRGDPLNQATPVVSSTESTYDNQGNKLTSKLYAGDFEDNSVEVSSSEVNTYGNDGKWLTHKTYGGDFEDRAVVVSTSFKNFYNYKGFSIASKEYDGDFDHNGDLKSSRTTTKIGVDETFNYTIKTKEYNNRVDFETARARPTHSTISITTKNGTTVTQRSRDYNGDCDTAGAVVSTSGVSVFTPISTSIKMFTGDNGRVTWSQMSNNNNFDKPLTQKTGINTDVERDGAVSSSALLTYDGHGNPLHSINYTGNLEVANAPITMERLIENYQPIHTPIKATELVNVFSEYYTPQLNPVPINLVN